MKKFVLVAVLFTAGCTANSADAIRAVEAVGLTNVQTTGYRFFACGKDDSFNTGFTATSATGKQVTGVVCSGWLKGATVRFD